MVVQCCIAVALHGGVVDGTAWLINIRHLMIGSFLSIKHEHWVTKVQLSSLRLPVPFVLSFFASSVPTKRNKKTWRKDLREERTEWIHETWEERRNRMDPTKTRKEHEIRPDKKTRKDRTKCKYRRNDPMILIRAVFCLCLCEGLSSSSSSSSFVGVCLGADDTFNSLGIHCNGFYGVNRTSAWEMV